MRKFALKRHLDAALAERGQDGSDALVVAVDRPDRHGRYTGSKRFVLCETVEEYESALAHPHAYEVVYSKHRTPTWLFLDIDAAREAEAGEAELQARTRATVALACRRLGLSRGEVGRTVQVATAHTPTKFSVHIKVNRLSTAAECEVIVGALAGLDADMSVYSEFRSFRALGCCKGGKSARLVPWGNSSPRLADHLVRAVPGHAQPVLPWGPVALPRAEEKRAAASRKRARPREGGGAVDAEGARLVAAAAATGMAARLRCSRQTLERNMLLHNVRVNDRGVSVAVCHAGITCPYAKRPHRSNNGVLRLANNELEYICLDRDCSVRPDDRLVLKCPEESVAVEPRRGPGGRSP